MMRSRRAVLRTGGAFLTVGIAGCLGSNGGSDVETVDSLPTPTLGSADAPVTVAAFEDYSCPHCQRYAQETFPKIRDEYVSEGVVQYEHYDFPIPVDDQWSWQTASAARAVQDTVDDEAFFAFSSAVYDHLGEYSLDVIGSVAEEVGADPETVRSAATDEVYRPVLEADRERGIDRGVEGTPTIFVDGSAASTYDWGTISSAIEVARP